MLEVAFRNSNVVARKDRNRYIESVSLIHTGAGSAQVDLVLVGSVSEPAGARDRVHHRQSKTVRILAALLDLAENVVRAILCYLDVHARIAHDSLRKCGCDRSFELRRRRACGLDVACKRD